MFSLYNNNPGLEPFDLTTYQGIKNRNYLLEDRILKRILLRFFIENQYSPDYIIAVWKHIYGFGEIAGSELQHLVEIAHREENIGKINAFNRSGDVINEIEYSYEQNLIRKITFDWGLLNLDQHDDWKHPFRLFHKMSLAYISNMNGEAGVNCPIAMTDGMIQALKSLGTPSQKKRYLSMITSPNTKSYFMCGQYITERVGGSNVGANRTIAKKIEEATTEEPAKYILVGEKWFCSNPGDLWVTTAKIEGTNIIGLFLIPKIKPDGYYNNFFYTRKKEIMGTKGKLTVETIYQETYAEELGKPKYGLYHLIKYIINVSRLHVAIAASGMSQRALMETYSYITYRRAYGKRIIDFSQSKGEYLKMLLKHITVTLANFYNFEFIEKEENDSLSELLTPLLKYISTITSTAIIRQAILFHGGNGILLDFSCLPRLLMDSIVNETWEGTHPVIQEHVIRALKKRKIQERLEDEFLKVSWWKFPLKSDEYENYKKTFFTLWEGFKQEWNQIEKDEELLQANKPVIVANLFYIIGFYLLLRECNFMIPENLYFDGLHAFFGESKNSIENLNKNLFSDFREKIENENLKFFYLLKFYNELRFLFQQEYVFMNFKDSDWGLLSEVISYFSMRNKN